MLRIYVRIQFIIFTHITPSTKQLCVHVFLFWVIILPSCWGWIFLYVHMFMYVFITSSLVDNPSPIMSTKHSGMYFLLHSLAKYALDSLGFKLWSNTMLNWHRHYKMPIWQLGRCGNIPWLFTVHTCSINTTGETGLGEYVFQLDSSYNGSFH